MNGVEMNSSRIYSLGYVRIDARSATSMSRDRDILPRFELDLAIDDSVIRVCCAFDAGWMNVVIESPHDRVMKFSQHPTRLKRRPFDPRRDVSLENRSKNR